MLKRNNMNKGHPNKSDYKKMPEHVHTQHAIID